MTHDLPTSAEIAPDPRLEKRTRRRFSAAEKLRLLTQADALPHGEQGAWLRRNGLYAAQLSGWRKQHAERGVDGLQAQAPGRKGADPLIAGSTNCNARSAVCIGVRKSPSSWSNSKKKFSNWSRRPSRRIPNAPDRHGTATCSSPSTAPRAGSTRVSTPTKAKQAAPTFCVACTPTRQCAPSRRLKAYQESHRHL